VIRCHNHHGSSFGAELIVVADASTAFSDSAVKSKLKNDSERSLDME